MSQPVAAAQRPYHHGNLHDALVDAGLELARRGGRDALGLRDVTRRVGVSPNAAYRHFADRSALVDAVAERIRALMVDRMRSPALPVPSDDRPTAHHPRARLRAVGLGYIEFALAEPGWFDVAFADIEPGSGSLAGSDQQLVSAPLAMLSEALDDLVRAGVLSVERRRGAEWPCWSTVHGFAFLALHGPLRGQPPEELRRDAAHSVEMIIDGLLSRPGPSGADRAGTPGSVG